MQKASHSSSSFPDIILPLRGVEGNLAYLEPPRLNYSNLTNLAQTFTLNRVRVTVPLKNHQTRLPPCWQRVITVSHHVCYNKNAL